MSTSSTKRPRAASKKSTEPADAEHRVARVAQKRWIPLGLTRINPTAQREMVQSRVDALLVNFDPEQLGTPTANFRDGWWWIIDGQHRVEALKAWLGDGWEHQHIEVDGYEGLTEAEEAEAFLKVNDTMAVSAYSKYRIGVTAGRPDEAAVEEILRAQNMKVTFDKYYEGGIKAAGTLLRVYREEGGEVLARTLGIIYAAYGQAGLEAQVIAGMALVVARYEELDDNEFVGRLSSAAAGIGGVLNKAERMRKETGNQKRQCIAAAIVDTANAKTPRGGKRLVSWWKPPTA